MARTSIRLPPDPKLASNAGASWLSPVRDSGDAASTPAPGAPGALDAAGPSGSSRLAATPCAASAAHMSGSQPMVPTLLTWPAIQAAACDRTDAATAADPAAPADRVGRGWCERAGDGTRAARGAPEDVLVSWTTPTAAAPTASTQTIRSSARARRGPGSRRDAHKRRVVASTRLHDGASGGAFGPAGVISWSAWPGEPVTCAPCAALGTVITR